MLFNELKLHLTIIFLITLVLFSVNVTIAAAASISGIIFQSDGITPLTGAEIWIEVYSGDPCNRNYVNSSFYNSSDGTYILEGLTAGTYYLISHVNEGNYFDEWWASPASVNDCSSAGSITITDGGAVTGKNFQLDQGATISGTAFHSDGTTPVTDGFILIGCYAVDACNNNWFDLVPCENTDGSYILEGLAPGSYYLKTDVINGNYLDEWWASPGSVRECSDAELITITDKETITGKNFQLDPGASLSGTIYLGDGITPLTGECIYILINSDDNPCDINFGNNVQSASYDGSKGTYSIGGLLPGTYHVRTMVEGDGFMCMGIDYLYDEWWASPASVRDCNDAQSIVITSTEAISGIDFQLDRVVKAMPWIPLLLLD